MKTKKNNSKSEQAQTASDLRKKFEGALQAGKATVSAMSDETREELRFRYFDMLENEDHKTRGAHLRWILESKAYLAVSENFVQFCILFCCATEQEVKSFMERLKAGDGASADPALPTTQAVGPKALQLADSGSRDRVLPASAEVLLETRPEYWACRINEAMGRSCKYLLKAGQELLTARTKLSDGTFDEILEKGLVKFDTRTGQMLMRIARNTVLSNPRNYPHVPHTLNALYLLSGVEEAKLQRAIDDGQVKPCMKIAETKALISQLQPPNKATIKEGEAAVAILDEGDLDDAFRQITKNIEHGMAACPTEQRRERLRQKLQVYLQCVNHPEPETAAWKCNPALN